MTFHTQPLLPLEHGARGKGWLRASVSKLGAVALIALASCSESTRVDGQVFISGVSDTAGNTIAVAIDFIPTRSDADLTQVALDIHISSGMLLVNGAAASAACLRLPSFGRLTLPADGGKLTADARVIVVALRENVLDLRTSNSSVPASTTGGSAGTAGGGTLSCPGVPIDDAIWPNLGAMALPSAGGASQGGTGGAIGGTGGESGSENAGTGPDEAGAGGSGGMGEAGDTGAGGVDMTAGQGGEAGP